MPTGRRPVTVDYRKAMQELQEAEVDMKRAIPMFLGRLAGAGEQKMKELIPVDTGNLRDSTGSDVRDDYATLTNSADYAWFVNDGTSPHIIKPKKKKALAFAPQGSRLAFRHGTRIEGVFEGQQKTAVSKKNENIETGRVVVKKVHHPGTEGVHFVEKTAEHLEEEAPREARKVIKRMVGR